MSGGVIKKYASKTLVKVRLDDGSIKWYSCSVPAFVGDVAIDETSGEKCGIVEEVLTQVTADKSPVPFSALREVTISFDE